MEYGNQGTKMNLQEGNNQQLKLTDPLIDIKFLYNYFTISDF